MRHPLIAALLVLLALPTEAGPLRDRIAERRQQAAPYEQLSDVAYGPHERHRFDIYLPKPRPTGAPIILLVHGGGWRHGDKAADSVVEHKVRHWVSQGVILVSTNYPRNLSWQRAICLKGWQVTGLTLIEGVTRWVSRN